MIICPGLQKAGAIAHPGKLVREDIANSEDRGMAFDFKKEYKEFYMPKNKPGIVTVPSMNYIAVRGQGDPNQEDGEYKQSIGLLYGILPSR